MLPRVGRRWLGLDIGGPFTDFTRFERPATSPG
jgi:hypothetical protein